MSEPIDFLAKRAALKMRLIRKEKDEKERLRLWAEYNELNFCLCELESLKIDLSFSGYSFSEWQKLNYEAF